MNTAVTDVFLRSHKIARQTLSLGVAVWFVFLSVSVHGLHRHTNQRCNAAAVESCAIEQNTRVSSTGAVWLTDDSEIEHGPRQNVGLCPACLFLKNCKERAVVWKSLDPVLASGNHPSHRTIFCHTTPVIVSSPPRAPPISIS